MTTNRLLSVPQTNSWENWHENEFVKELHRHRAELTECFDYSKDAPTAAERAYLFRRYQDQFDTFAERVKDAPEDEIDAAIEEAVKYVRHHAE